MSCWACYFMPSLNFFIDPWYFMGLDWIVSYSLHVKWASMFTHGFAVGSIKVCTALSVTASLFRLPVAGHIVMWSVTKQCTQMFNKPLVWETFYFSAPEEHQNWNIATNCYLHIAANRIFIVERIMGLLERKAFYHFNKTFVNTKQKTVFDNWMSF